jgi:hypothetical protein
MKAGGLLNWIKEQAGGDGGREPVLAGERASETAGSTGQSNLTGGGGATGG